MRQVYHIAILVIYVLPSIIGIVNGQCRGDLNATRGCDKTCMNRCPGAEIPEDCKCPKNSCKCKKGFLFDPTNYKCVAPFDCTSELTSTVSDTTTIQPDTTWFKPTTDLYDDYDDTTTTIEPTTDYYEDYDDTTTTIEPTTYCEDDYDDATTTIGPTTDSDDDYDDTTTTIELTTECNDNYDDITTTMEPTFECGDYYDDDANSTLEPTTACADDYDDTATDCEDYDDTTTTMKPTTECGDDYDDTKTTIAPIPDCNDDTTATIDSSTDCEDDWDYGDDTTTDRDGDCTIVTTGPPKPTCTCPDNGDDYDDASTTECDDDLTTGASTTEYDDDHPTTDLSTADFDDDPTTYTSAKECDYDTTTDASTTECDDDTRTEASTTECDDDTRTEASTTECDDDTRTEASTTECDDDTRTEASTTECDDDTRTEASTTECDDDTRTEASTTECDDDTRTEASTTECDDDTITKASTTECDDDTRTEASTTECDENATTDAPTTDCDKNKTTDVTATAGYDGDTTTNASTTDVDDDKTTTKTPGTELPTTETPSTTEVTTTEAVLEDCTDAIDRFRDAAFAFHQKFLASYVSKYPTQTFTGSPTATMFLLGFSLYFAKGSLFDELSKSLALNDRSEIVCVFNAINNNSKNLSPGIYFEPATDIAANINFKFTDKAKQVMEKDVIGQALNLDFSSNSSVSAINKVISEQTNNQITNVVQKLDNSYQLAYFSGFFLTFQWKIAFQPKVIKKLFFEAPFVAVQTDFMIQKDMFNYTESSILQAKVLRLNSINDEFSVIVILPHATFTVNQLIERCTPQNLKQAIGSMKPVLVNVEVPMINLTSYVDTLQVIEAANISRTLTSNGTAQYKNAFVGNNQIDLSYARQKVTYVSGTDGGKPPNANKPFNIFERQYWFIANVPHINIITLRGAGGELGDMPVLSSVIASFKPEKLGVHL